MFKVKENKMLLIFTICAIAFFGFFLKMNYSVDTYLLFASENLGYVQEFIKSGRFITAFLFKILQFFRFTPETMYVVSFIIGIACTTFAIYTLYIILKKYIKSDFINAIISIATIINPFIIELWLFAEMGIMMLSILACVLAFKHFDEYLENNKKREIGLCIAFMLIALFSYQGTVAIFMALSSISVILHSNKLKLFIKNTLIYFLCYGIPTIINFVVVMLIGNKRVGGNYNFIQTISFIFNASNEQLFKGFGLYPKILFILLYVLIVVGVIIYIIMLDKGTKQKTLDLLKYLYMLFITYFFTIATIIPQNVSSAVMFPRNSYAYGSLVGLSLIFVTTFTKTKKEIKYKNQFIVAISIGVLIMEFIQFTNIGINRYIVNYMDKYIVYEINDKINKYENETGIKVENVAIYNLDSSSVFYPEINDMINISAKNEKMSGAAILELFMHRKLKETQQNKDIYNKYFKDNNWSMFNLDQIVLEGKTMHWYLY
ncbi:MAG: glucosyltransferase domain-containing protein [Clostridia bacterium]|nr:glucosyltransferase domain-containing protein [Clostridia bacterium]